jgi:hypothetical protein
MKATYTKNKHHKFTAKDIPGFILFSARPYDTVPIVT